MSSLLTRKMSLGTREVGQSIKDLSHQHKDLNLVPSIQMKSQRVEKKIHMLYQHDEDGDKIPRTHWPDSLA